MDLTRDITYRGFLLNDSQALENITTGGQSGTGITGCVLDSADVSDVDVVQFTEKRSQQDGLEAGIPFMGGRRIRLAGTLYGTTRPALFDTLNDLRAAMNPILAYRESLLDFGYRPLTFSVPTLREDEFDGPIIQQRMLAMPRSFQATFSRDASGGEDEDALAIPWQATLVCRDPSITGAEYQEYDLSTSSPVTGDFVNRGNHYAPLMMLIQTGTAAGSISVSAGGTTFTITVPASTGSRIIRLDSQEKTITFEEDDVVAPRRDLLTLSADQTWPLVQPGTNAYTVTFNTVTHTTGSIMWFYERYA